MIFSANSAVSAVKDYPSGDFKKALRILEILLSTQSRNVRFLAK